jgi:hypothetical protein
MPRTACPISANERALLLRLEHAALRYFVDNQTPCGLVLDRQRNHGAIRMHGLCSLTATGMGLIALALASAPPHRLLSRTEAVRRVRKALETALLGLPHDRGVLPHFVDSLTLAPCGVDAFSTVETSWLVGGALWAAAFLVDPLLHTLAEELHRRVDWTTWAAPDGLVRHGKDGRGRWLPCTWDRLNGETIFLYVLAASGAPGRAIDPSAFAHLGAFRGTVAGLEFNNADLGLFVFQYGLDLLDLRGWRCSATFDLATEAATATLANYRTCRQHANRFATYRDYWGLSAGDGPGGPHDDHVYRDYSPRQHVDGTAHLTAALASVAHAPDLVLDALDRAGADPLAPLGRYGFSSINRDRVWVGPWMVGIDAGAAVVALENYLGDDRIRRVMHHVAAVDDGLQRLGFTTTGAAPAVRLAS